MNIESLKKGDRIKITVPHHAKYDYLVRSVDASEGPAGGIVCVDRNELKRGNEENPTMHCIGRPPLDHYLAQGLVHVADAAV